MTSTETDEVAQTLAEYERIAIESGSEVRIDPPEFSANGITESAWSPVWAGEDPPMFARATVYRDGVPTTVYVSWVESLPAADEWRDLWLRKRMKLFGAYTLRTALRRAYRDVIGDRREPDETDETAVNADRDWSAELAEATTPEAVTALWEDAKRARVVTVDLEAALRRKVKALAEPLIKTVAPLMAVVAEAENAAIPKPRPLPTIPTIRPEEMVRKSKSRPQRQKPRGPRA